MSVLELTNISQPKDAADYLYQLLQDKGPEFGLENIEYDSKLIRRYPAAVITPGRKDKIQHSTQFFRVILEVMIGVYHARLTETHRERTRNDLILCEQIEAAIESEQLDWGQRVTQAWVSEVAPGTFVRPKGEQVVASRMTVLVDTREIMSKGV
jgi:hypothetical protein